MNELYEKWKCCGCPICKIAIFSIDLKEKLKTSKKYAINNDKN
tara:strand:+ start:491 stop:619 length:129 start_codon:yes stop_codon:yes gene_type:complete